MRVRAADAVNREAFLRYCGLHGKDHDESFIPDAEKLPHEDYPAYLLYDGERVVGATCLVRTPPFVADNKGRFMIFHTAPRSAEGYALLLDALRPHFAGLRRVYLFVPDDYREVRETWEELGFIVERWAYLLSYRQASVPPPELSPSFSFAPVSADDPDLLRAAVELDNLNFAGGPGHVEYSVEKLLEDLQGEEMIDGGLMLLCDGERPVGTVWVSRDDEEGASFVSMLTVHADYRGRGLGRALLRRAIAFSHEHGLSTVYLSVSAENDTAVRLYLGEGFKTDKVLVCYQMFV